MQQDVDARTDETLVNLRSIMDEVHEPGLTDVRHVAHLLLKVYLRQPESRLREISDLDPQIFHLQAGICRRQLLLEIGAVCRTGSTSS